MKRVMVLSAMALVILLSSAAIQANDAAKGKAKTKQKARTTSRKAKGLTEAEKQWREKLKKMTPEQRRAAMAQRAFEKSLAPWQEIRKIAVGEKAEKTVAAIDKVIAAKKAQFKKKLEAMAKKKAASADKPKKKAVSADKPKKKRPEGEKTKRKKRPEGEKRQKKKKAKTEN